MSQIVAAYLEDRKGRAVHPEAMALAWRSADEEWAGLQPHQITRQRCRDWSAKQEAGGKSRGTIRKQLSIMGAALKWYEPQGPAVVELPAPPPPRERYLTRAEAGLLLDACQPLHLRVFVVLALTTAARAGAILSLTWPQVDFAKGWVDYGQGPARNKQRALAPMNHSCRAVLTKAAEARETDHVVEYDGRPVRSVKRAFAKAVKDAGLEGVTPHVLRHTAAVWMAENGVRLEEIAQLMGHTSVAVTYKVYSRFSPDYLKKAVGSLEVNET